ncbi:uncharacterized protein LOC128209480 [Mya arenaria]|uniref:uncharacterized protein LOC128209480 n=1 Tax=Mya arenaria TaxID=6604 RepID=UPI0022E92A17|nr:uncharacterized protein LOC128209480 [Mya arenaria]
MNLRLTFSVMVNQMTLDRRLQMITHLDHRMADIMNVLAFVFIVSLVQCSTESCRSYDKWLSSVYPLNDVYYITCQTGCCHDIRHPGYYKCCDTNSLKKFTNTAGSVLTIGPIIGIVVGAVTLVACIVSVIVCCVCCMTRSRVTHGRTVTTAADGPYVISTSQTSQGIPMQQTFYGQQQGQAQPPLPPGYVGPGTAFPNNQGMQEPPPYGKSRVY